MPIQSYNFAPFTAYQEGEDEYADTPQVGRSFMAGLHGLRGSLQSTGGALARVVGANETAENFEEDADLTAAKAAGIRGRGVPTLEEADSLGDYGTIATDWIASNGPLMATMAVGGPAGAALWGGRAALSGAAKAGIREAAKRGGTAGVAAPYFTVSTGENVQRTRNDPEATGTPRQQALAGLGTAGVQTALGMRPLGNLGGMLGKGAGAGKILATTAAAEGVTEAGEQFLGRAQHGLFNENVNLFDADARKEYIESMLAGAVVGGAYGGMGLAGRSMLDRARRTPEDPAKPEDDTQFKFGDEGNTENDRVRVKRMYDILDLIVDPESGLDDVNTFRAASDEMKRLQGRMRSDRGRNLADAIMRMLMGEPGRVPRGMEGLGEPIGTTRLAGTEFTGGDAQSAQDLEEGRNPSRIDAFSEGINEETPQGVEYFGNRRTGEPYVYDPENNMKGVGEKELAFMRGLDPDSTYTPISLAQRAKEAGENVMDRAAEIAAIDLSAPLTELGEQPGNQYTPYYMSEVGMPLLRKREVDGEISNLQRMLNQPTISKRESERMYNERKKLVKELDATPNPDWQQYYSSAIERIDALTSRSQVMTPKRKGQIAASIKEKQAQSLNLEAEAREGAEKFLGRFQVIKREPSHVEVMPEEGAFQLSARDLVSKKRKILSMGKENPGTDKDGKVTNNRYLEGKLGDGTQVWVDLPNLASTMLNRLTDANALPQGEGVSSLERATSALEAGLSSLAYMHGIYVNLDMMAGKGGAFDSDLIVWYDEKNKPIRVRDLLEKLGGGEGALEMSVLGENIQRVAQKQALIRDKTFAMQAQGFGQDAIDAELQKMGAFDESHWQPYPGTREYNDEAAKKEGFIEKGLIEPQPIKPRTRRMSDQAKPDTLPPDAMFEPKDPGSSSRETEEGRELYRQEGDDLLSGGDPQDMAARYPVYRAERAEQLRAAGYSEATIQRALEDMDMRMATDREAMAKQVRDEGPLMPLSTLLQKEAAAKEGRVADVEAELEEAYPEKDPAEEWIEQEAQREAAAEKARKEEAEKAKEREAREAEARAKEQERTAKHKTHRTKMQDVLNGMTRLLGLPQMRLLSYREAIDMLEKRGKRKKAQQVASGHARGFYDPETNSVYVSPLINAAHAVTTMMHEVGHAVFYQKFSKLDPKDQEAVVEAHDAWSDWAFERDSVGDARLSKEAAAELWMGVLDDPWSISELSPERRQYVLSLQEWFADNVARWAETTAAPQGVVEKFFKEVADTIKKLVKRMQELVGVTTYTADVTVAEYLDELVRQAEHDAYHSEKQGPQPPQTGQGPAQSGGGAGGTGGTPPAPPGGPTQEPPPGGPDEPSAILRSLTNWWSRWAGGNATALSNRMIRDIRYHIRQHMTQAEQRTLLKAAEGTQMQSAMRRVIGADNHKLLDEIERDPLTASAYLFALTRLGLVTPGPRASEVMENFADRMARLYNGAIGNLTTKQAEDNILEAIRRGELENRDPRTAPDYTMLAPGARRYNNAALLKAIHDKAIAFRDKVYAPLMQTDYERIMNSDNAFLERIARLIDTPPWDARGRSESFLEAKPRRFDEFFKMYSRALGVHKKDKAFKRQVVEVFNNPDLLGSASPEVKDAVESIRGMFDKMYDYSAEAKLKLQRRKNYAPWVFSVEYLEGHMDEFIEFAKRPQFMSEWQNMHNSWRNKGRVPPEMGIDEFIAQRLQSLLKPEGVQTSRTADENHNPGFRFMNPRDLNFLQAKGTAADRVELSKFFEKDLDAMILSYINSSVKRTEYTRRFGQNGERLNELLAQAREEGGATVEEEQIVRGMVNAALGMHGVDTRERVESMLMSRPVPDFIKRYFLEQNEQGQYISTGQGVMNPQLQNLMGWIITYQNYRLLSMSVFSSFVDPIGVAMRTGNFTMQGKAIRDAMAHLWDATDGDAQRLQSLVDMLGTIDRAMTAEDIAETYYGHQMSPTQRKLNDFLFKWNGVEHLTAFSRKVGTAGANSFIREHSRRAGTDEQSLRYLEELGLRKGDVHFNEDGDVDVMDDARRATASPEEVARDDRVRAAFRRFVDSTSVRPDSADRPSWANDQHWSLAAHLKTFTFSFHNNVIKRVSHEAEQGQYAPMLMLAATFVPMMLFADWLRDMIKYGPEGAAWKEHWGMEEHLGYAIKRAGLLGRDEITADVLDPAFSGDPMKGLAEAFGPTGSQIRKLMMWGPSESDLPLQTIFRHWD